MQCPRCFGEVRDFERNCPVCNHDCGYPNVRAARRPEERQELAKRLQAAEASAKGRRCVDVFSQFRRAVSSSWAVICRSLSQVRQLVESDNALYASFYDLVGMGARRPEDSTTEHERLLTDNLLFPHYHDKIRFAVLSLDGLGAKSYGDCSLVLKDIAIRDRATVFEENSLYFCRERGLGLGKPVPLGYRALWNDRDQLAAVKLEALQLPGMQYRDFAGILLRVFVKPPHEEFIEVHIYGPLHRQSIERLVTRKPKRKAQRAILKDIQRKLTEVGAKVEFH